MSTQSGHAYSPPVLVGAAVARPAQLGVLKVIERVRDRLRRRRQLQSLVELDDRLLADIGVTREQAERAVRQLDWCL